MTRFLLAAVFASFTVIPVTTRAAPPETTEAADDSLVRVQAELIAILMANPSNEKLAETAQAYRQRGDIGSAAIINLTALRGKPNDASIEFELACIFSHWEQPSIASDYLKLAADHGFSGYRSLTEGSTFKSIERTPEFAAASKKIKANFDAQAVERPLGMTVAPPQGRVPAAGWPVLVFLHGWGSNRHDFDENAKFVSTLGYIGLTLDGTHSKGPDSYEWDQQSVEPTHARIQAALKKLDLKADLRRVYLHGFSQGAMHAARLAADHPDAYRGVICNSPGSPHLIPATLKDAPATGPIIISVGNQEKPHVRENSTKLEALWKSAGRPVRVIRFEGGHHLPPEPARMFRDALEQFDQGK